MHRGKYPAIVLLLIVGWAGAQSSAPAPSSGPGVAPIQVGSSRTDPSKAEALEVRKALLGKALTIAGKTLDGKDFSSAQYKGKVVLVHFWASWCPDCAVEMPSVIKLYQQYHDRGLEIVGISSDVAAEDLSNFLKKKTDVSWVQLYTPPEANGRNPLNTTYGVDWIPTVFLIDRNGMCRSVDGDKEMAELVPKLLAEK